MPKPYSQDLRERVVRSVEAGASCHEAAAAFEVGVMAIRWVARWRGTGSVAAKPMGGTRSPLDAHIRLDVGNLNDWRISPWLMLHPDTDFQCRPCGCSPCGRTTVLAAMNKCSAQSNKSRTEDKCE
jgi:hypothetical protein